MIHTLFPSFWLLLVAFLCLSVAVIVFTIDNKWLHILLLFQLSLLLYYTPISLSGFTQNPDALWFAAIGRSIPDVLSGANLKLCEYGEAYPISFIMIYSITQLTGIDINAYVLYLHPIFGIFAVVLLCYIFASKFLSSRNAFMSMLFALPALHYFQLHMSPQFAGFLLILAIMLFLVRFDRKSMIIALSLMFLLTSTHPSSPLLLGAFLLTIFIYRLFNHGSRIPLSLSSILFLGTAWLGWTLYHAVFVLPGVEASIRRTVTLDFLRGILTMKEVTKLGGGFIYPQISALNQIVYIGYLIFALTPLFFQIVRLNFRPKRRLRIGKPTDNLTLKKFVPLISGPVFFFMSYCILLVGTQNPDQLLKAFVFFILMVSMQIASFGWFSTKTKKVMCKRTFAVMWLVFLFISFPVISYSTSAYDVFPPSEGIGMNFVTSRLSLNEKKISMYMTRQLVAYINASQYFRDADFPPIINNTSPEARARSPDIVVLRETAFFRIAMRFDMSFEINRFTQLRQVLNVDSFYNKVYSSSTFEIYVHQK
jgi:hypothetical protein